jgi:hypothetical protein
MIGQAGGAGTDPAFFPGRDSNPGIPGRLCSYPDDPAADRIIPPPDDLDPHPGTGLPQRREEHLNEIIDGGTGPDFCSALYMEGTPSLERNRKPCLDDQGDTASCSYIDRTLLSHDGSRDKGEPAASRKIAGNPGIACLGNSPDGRTVLACETRPGSVLPDSDNLDRCRGNG